MMRTSRKGGRKGGNRGGCIPGNSEIAAGRSGQQERSGAATGHIPEYGEEVLGWRCRSMGQEAVYCVILMSVQDGPYNPYIHPSHNLADRIP